MLGWLRVYGKNSSGEITYCKGQTRRRCFLTRISSGVGCDRTHHCKQPQRRYSRTFGGSQKGGFQKGGFGGCSCTKNWNEGTFACSPGMKTGTRVRSHVPQEQKPETRVHSPKPPFYETALYLPVKLLGNYDWWTLLTCVFDSFEVWPCQKLIHILLWSTSVLKTFSWMRKWMLSIKQINFQIAIVFLTPFSVHGTLSNIKSQHRNNCWYSKPLMDNVIAMDRMHFATTLAQVFSVILITYPTFDVYDLSQIFLTRAGVLYS